MAFWAMEQPDKLRLEKSTGKLLIEAPGHGSYLAYIRNLIGDLARQVGFPEDEVAKIEMAVDEACSNVVEHAYADPKDAIAPEKAWQWKQANGAPRDMVCRGLLLMLHRAGEIQLPPVRFRGSMVEGMPLPSRQRPAFAARLLRSCFTPGGIWVCSLYE